MIREIYGQIGKVWAGNWTLPTNTGYKGAITYGPNVGGQGIPRTDNVATVTIPAYDIFSAAFVVPTGPQNAPVTVSERWMRRVA